jgi:hypothetical protein
MRQAYHAETLSEWPDQLRKLIPDLEPPEENPLENWRWWIDGPPPE